MTTVLDRLKKVISKLLAVDEATILPGSHFIEDLGADSLGLVELVMSMEEEFKIEISEEDMDKMATVQDAVNYLKGKGIE